MLDIHCILKIFIPATSLKEGFCNIEIIFLAVLIVRLKKETFYLIRVGGCFQR